LDFRFMQAFTAGTGAIRPQVLLSPIQEIVSLHKSVNR
jgi:hypothetical protein